MFKCSNVQMFKSSKASAAVDSNVQIERLNFFEPF